MRKRLLRSRSGFEKPESREEAIMQNILGASNVLEPSESNIEEILKSILYNTPYTKEAEFEIEKILLAIKNNGTYDGECESRDLKILFAILNDLDYTEEAESRIEELFIEWLNQRSKIKVLEGIPPLTFVAKGEPLINYEISGNMIQSGTPSPDTPIMPQGTGERTANLCDYSKFESTNTTITIITNGINLTGKYFARYRISLDINTAYAMNWVSEVISGTPDIAWRIQYTDNTYSAFANKGSSLTPTKAVLGILLYVTQSDATASVNFTNIMLSSTALPYEPYGYKIPILSNSTTTNVYLGEVQSTRRIKKLVLTGEENWTFVSSSNIYIDNTGAKYSSTDQGIICSHFKPMYAGHTDGTCRFANYGRITFHYNSVSNVDEWESYLTQQYAAGTPVTVWYVLATEETAVVNEQLQKIGDYADTLSMEQAGVEIPTINGSNTFDVDTTVKPSNVYIEYK